MPGGIRGSVDPSEVSVAERSSQSPPAVARRYWWVNQNQTHLEEISGGFMWSPKVKSNGSRNRFYDNMLEAQAGDAVFSFYDTRIQAVGVVTATAETAPRPDFGAAGQSNSWANEGWLVGAEFTRVASSIRPKEHIELIRPLLPSKYSPLRDNGDGLQSVYLAEISTDLADLLLDLSGAELPDRPPETSPDPPPEAVAEEEQHLADLQGRTDIGQTDRVQLVKARRGQGIFRNNVRMNESRCRVTLVMDPAHLRGVTSSPGRIPTTPKSCTAATVCYLLPMSTISSTRVGSPLVTMAI